MITVSTTSAEEAGIVAFMLRHALPRLDYRVFLLGSEVAARTGGGAEVLDIKIVPPPVPGSMLTAGDV